jgi:AcrR family transcriptional regulator
MSGSGAATPTEPPRALSPRRHLSARQADTVARLTHATVEELRAVGYAGLTVRNVARRAGVAAATAYTYFASKDHLVTEVYWQRLQRLDLPPEEELRGSAERAGEVLTRIGLLVADEPELSAACTVAVLADDPEVCRIRDAIAAHTTVLLRAALGPDASTATLRTLGAVFSGVLLQAGIGILDYDEVAAQLRESAELILGEPARPRRSPLDGGT